MATAPSGFPQFDHPPVVETVIGVEFAPIDGWEVPHFGLFWNELRRTYPKTQMVPALPSMIEKYGKEHLYAGTEPSVEFIKGEPPVRAFFADDASGKLLQIQRDRLLHNWRKTGRESAYPGYAETRVWFTTAWERFLSFLASNELRRPDVTQCEVTYINHIERGAGWDSLADLPTVTPLLSGKGSTGFLGVPEVTVLTARYLMPEQRGRLHLALQPALRNADQREILQLQLTARGMPQSSTTEHVLEWIDLGHEWVVKSFADATSTVMHNIWGRRV
ncbi:MAG TPA: TIGR04255 family protein [Methylomirabilota bacterium]|nr:TIGR04255 family protein [Methylomirabilota bacterium]